jgi:hypothetical protein
MTYRIEQESNGDTASMDIQRYIDKGYDIDDIGAILNIGVKIGKEHSVPSPETIRRIHRLEIISAMTYVILFGIWLFPHLS